MTVEHVAVFAMACACLASLSYLALLSIDSLIFWLKRWGR